MSEQIAQSRNDSLVKVLSVGVAALALCAVGAFLWPDIIARAYLVAYLFWTGIALGSLVLLMILQLTGGNWGLAIDPTLRAAASTLPLAALFFIPILLVMPQLFEWIHPESTAHPELILKKVAYLNTPFFILRAILYFVIWSALAWLLGAWSKTPVEQVDPQTAQRRATAAGPGLVLYALTLTFATTDWVMSLQPEWFSTMLPVILGALQVGSALAFAICVLSQTPRDNSVSDHEYVKRLRDLGNLLLAAVMFWAYVAFSEFMLIWAANLPEEVVWYIPRLEGGWQWVASALLVFQFGIPFLALLLRAVRSRPERLSLVAWLVLIMVVINLVWQVIPAFDPPTLLGHTPDLLVVAVAMIGIGAIWFTAIESARRARIGA